MNEMRTSKRPWRQFGLRTLMVFVLLCAIVCSLFAMMARQAEEQRKTVEMIRELGGVVRYDFEFDVNNRRIPTAKLPDLTWLQNLLGVDFFSDVHYVTFAGPCVGDEELAHLSVLTDLRWLWLGAGEIVVEVEPVSQWSEDVRLMLHGLDQPRHITDVWLYRIAGPGHRQGVE